jgi:tRNA(Ile)-lysidine synthase
VSRLDPAVAAVRSAVRASLADLAVASPDPDAEPLVLVAISGGPDSTALAAAVAFEAARAGVGAGAVTVDHGLQDESAAVTRAAAATATSLGLGPVVVEQVEVGRRGGVEAAARAARYDALAGVARRLGALAVFLGHTRDDQAETVLLGLARGAGARSMRGMRTVDGLWRRPLLTISREQTHAACEAQQLAVWHDPHNDDRQFVRVRLRHDVLPALADAVGPGVLGALARTAQRLQSDDDALTEWAQLTAQRARCDDGGVSVDVMVGVPEAVRTRVLRHVALEAGVPGGSLASGHIATVDALLMRWRGQGPASLPGGVTVHRRCGRLYFGTTG